MIVKITVAITMDATDANGISSYAIYKMSFANNLFFKAQFENLVKIVINVMITENEKRLLIILDKYLFIGVDLRNLAKDKKENIEANIDNYEKILEEMLDYSKNNYQIKVSKKLVKFN